MSKILACLFVTFLLQGLEALPSQQTKSGPVAILDAVDQSLKSADLLFGNLKQWRTSSLESDVNSNLDILKCLAQHEEQLKNVVENGQAAIRSCLAKGEEKIAVLREQFNKLKEQLQAKAEELQKIYLACQAEGGDEAAVEKCVEEKGEAVINDLVELLRQLGEAIVQGEIQIYSIIVETRNCIAQAVIRSKEELIKVLQDVGKCINESN